ncbi:ATP:cob(I)alamin adenosyltransferase [Pyrodictium abyssi]|uniref:Cob(I)yrinic acid a,c-diamide adenosyltransferase n=1 Tax=Pyrodictium abyssi TaxID=54256 RepID=A0ABM8J094_9CREN|nr:cob(I)yrinic acid a,c-diamide adenosyltransferase [Pyrodictium abyssi]
MIEWVLRGAALQQSRERRRIYTRSGDDGYTMCLLTGSRVPKTHPCIEFVGALDEAEAALGLAQSLLEASTASGDAGRYARILEYMQVLLFRAGFTLAGRSCIDGDDIRHVEELIDELSVFIKPLFTINGGHPAAAATSYARAVIRRAERSLWRCIEAIDGNVPEQHRMVARLLNRLSDLAYALQHAINAGFGVHVKRVDCGGKS